MTYNKKSDFLKMHYLRDNFFLLKVKFGYVIFVSRYKVF